MLYLIIILSLLAYKVWRRATSKPRFPYPPGPEPKPLIGNLFDISLKGKPWLKYWDMSKRLNSDIIHLSVMNTHLVLLHNKEDAIALLEKRSAIYSDRPYFAILDSVGIENTTGAIQYGDAWRQQRRVFQEGIRKARIQSYQRIITEKMHLMLEQMLLNPADFSEHCKILAASVVLSVGFGHDLIPGKKNHRFIDYAEYVDKMLAELIIPGRTLISVLPFLRHIPPWMPGASTQRLLAEARLMADVCRNETFESVKKNLGTSKPCIAATILKRHSAGSHDEGPLKDAFSAMFLAGVETIHSSMDIFIMTMALHPDKQRKAQDEIDQIVGIDRLPTFEDRQSLPYVEAFYREALRWRQVGPLCPAHSNIEDDVYKDHLIPKGSLVMVNTWAITRDETTYKDPESFLPERFFKADGTLNDDTVGYVFGFGRRICPGRHLADAELWLAICSMLAVFNISKARDDNGSVIEIDADALTESLICYPAPFKCSITPRSLQAKSLIQNATHVAREHLRSVG